MVYFFKLIFRFSRCNMFNEIPVLNNQASCDFQFTWNSQNAKLFHIKEQGVLITGITGGTHTVQLKLGDALYVVLWKNGLNG
jgi:hypothetical protein